MSFEGLDATGVDSFDENFRRTFRGSVLALEDNEVVVALECSQRRTFVAAASWVAHDCPRMTLRSPDWDEMLGEIDFPDEW